jgi:hypothetical protein
MRIINAVFRLGSIQNLLIVSIVIGISGDPIKY